uniref:Uncharacterized protein n=1 Tax=Timema bartmani TaxID=61472 RepID=A0A7R9FAT5_9NEOP|nr:unnamed protein product [Timema bartmani]
MSKKQCKKGQQYSNRVKDVGETFYHLDSSPVRITAVDIPMPYANSLEVATLPQASDIIHTVKKILATSEACRDIRKRSATSSSPGS